MRKAAGACLLAATVLAAAPLPRPYAVDRYSVRIRPDFAGKRIAGEVELQLHSTAESEFSGLELDAGGLDVKSVAEGKTAAFFEKRGERLVVVLATPLEPGEHRTLTVRYQAGAGRGLRVFDDQIYTMAGPSDWMVCNDWPGDRPTLHLEIAVPEGAKAAASGVVAGATAWDLETPTPVSLFGFVVGTFAESASEVEGVKLRVLGAHAPTPESTASVLRYLAERTGKKYPGTGLTQVMVHGDGAQSLAGGLVMLPDREGGDARLLADQVAHQWYGVAITPKDWSDLWLADGVSAFLADGFLGTPRYEREVATSRQAYQALQREGKDRPLSYTDWKSAADAGGVVPVQKGVSFLYLVRTLMGDSAFWSGWQRYTAGRWGQSATSEDFQAAMMSERLEGKNAKAVGKSVGQLFDQWVFGLAPPSKPSKK